MTMPPFKENIQGVWYWFLLPTPFKSKTNINTNLKNNPKNCTVTIFIYNIATLYRVSDIAAMVTENENLLNNSNIMFFTVCWIVFGKISDYVSTVVIIRIIKRTFFPDQCWSGKKWGTKVFNWLEVHFYRRTTYKIHTLVSRIYKAPYKTCLTRHMNQVPVHLLTFS